MKTKILFFSLLVLFTNSIIKAQIVYNEAWVTLNSPDTNYLLDINQDDNIDYEISFFANTPSDCYSITCKSYNDNYIGAFNAPVKDWEPYSYENNTMIDETLNWYTFNIGHGGSLSIGSNCTAFNFGNFRGVVDEYIGLKFSDLNGTYYGWIRVDVDSDGDWITIKDYAYESNGNGILTSTITEENNIESNSTGISFYPNPSNDKIHIIVPEAEFDVSVLNVCGKEILHESNNNIIDISILPPGSYFVRINCNDKNNITQLIIY